ncbi:DUF5059 domain-containing protein [Halorhabdus sp. CBA1104]|uniref:DUF5059 domain-containing protein n=1 Tax=Halorhabdus sp. CBA1104 TaxID=1380432 RepID=UPI0012B2FB07|nr:DUF5059 domain-containing protein [Halorhabdus sp. CBA1104]QGN06070.1 DUF5059 domain-containing protein [Halorhabdus sp. CBA1104]
MPSRREVLASGAALLGTVGLAGCSAPEETTTEGGSGGNGQADANAAVAAEWNTMRARVRDAVALGRAGAPDAGGALAQNVFARFENAGGEYGAHEMLEGTDSEAYEGFESALGALRSEGLSAGDLQRASDAADTATGHLADAQGALLSEGTAQAYDLQALAATVQNTAFLLETDNPDAAATVAEDAQARFEDGLGSAFESADSDTFDSLEGSLENLVSNAGSGNSESAMANADLAVETAVAGSYSLADDEHAAGAGHVALFGAMGWDAAALASLGGPSLGVAHAATLTTYRARVADAAWLVAAGEREQAATVVTDVFAHFEGARAHDGLESAAADAYEGFESGLEALQTAIEEGEDIAEPLATVDENLVAGIEALTGEAAPVLAAAFFRARVADARERYRRDEGDAAASIAQDLFARFEEDELGFHEAVEETSEDLYDAFEEEHLAGLIDAFEAGDSEAVRTHDEGIHSTLLEYATTAAETPVVSAGEAAIVTARGFDAAVLDTLGNDDRAQAIAQRVFEHFEGDPGGYHEALEHADAETYEAFEAAIGAVSQAAENGEAVYPPTKTFGGEAVASAYAVVEAAGGPQREVALGIAEDAFARFESARVHELLEEADRNAYETFEASLEGLVEALDGGGDVASAAESFANATQYAQFALVDASEDVPLDLDLAGAPSGGHSEESSSGGHNSNLSGGPNVVEGVPEDADHVVDMTAAAFEPEELTVESGDTVAWTFVGGEPHSVSAYEEKIPDDAEYWASGGFDSEEAAREGWTNGEGAVQSGQSYVHTFETTGEHGYVCIPHEAVGMVGTIVVE